MKKMRLFVAVAALGLGTFAFTSCSAEVETTEGDGTEQKDEKSEDKADKKDEEKAEPSLADKMNWVCPDECQEGRMYFEAGKCKGCDADLVEKE